MMDLTEEIKEIYNTKVPIEQKFLDFIIEVFREIDFNKLSTEKNQTFILNENVLTISLQHRENNDRRLLLILQNDFIEVHVGYSVRTFFYENIIDNASKIKEFKDFLLLMLDSPYKQVDYYINDNLIKYSTEWNENVFKMKTLYSRPFGRIFEKFGKKRNYEKRESKAESFLKVGLQEATYR